MEITSLFFLLLFFFSIFVYYLIPDKHRPVFLTLLSVGYIASISINLLGYVVFYSLINYVIGLRLPKSHHRKLLFILGLVFNLGQLIILQYESFALAPLTNLLNLSWDTSMFARIIVPVGVSFFTLQGIGYLVNIQLNWEKPERNFLHFLLYISFFPRFLSGPIDRSNKFLPQIKEGKTFSEQHVVDGIRLLLLGLFKKIVIANHMAIDINQVYSNIGSSSDHSLWIVLLIQPLYIYFDFSAYTDIAMGIARTYGINLRPNFDKPFMAESVTMFWKRFHMSLSSWFHDYLFMRFLFRFRKWSKHATTIALFITWVLFGVWHGAGWNFMVLGLLQAIAIFYEFKTKRWRNKVFSRLPELFRRWVGRIFTYVFYAISLVMFFSKDLRSAFVFFSRIGQHERIWTEGILDDLFVLTLSIFLIIVETLQTDYKHFYEKIQNMAGPLLLRNRWIRWSIYLIAIMLIKVFNFSNQQFIYFQF